MRVQINMNVVIVGGIVVGVVDIIRHSISYGGRQRQCLPLTFMGFFELFDIIVELGIGVNHLLKQFGRYGGIFRVFYRR
jgi:hypothetical protein